MLQSSEFKRRLEEAMRDESGIIVPEGKEPVAYYEALRNSVRSAACEPFLVRATITGDDFPDQLQGQQVAAYVLAASKGYWLAYQPELDMFYCFWGSEPTRLGAHREAGSPLFLWWS